MKISKLFHWLYAVVMLLPIMYILSRSLYAIFNENATLSVGTLDSIFIDSLNNINTINVFSWATNTFLNEPFEYISDLFGMSSSNPIITLLAYWLSMSIIWLVFDLLMYVPLLVHRWLDKGILE